MERVDACTATWKEWIESGLRDGGGEWEVAKDPSEPCRGQARVKCGEKGFKLSSCDRQQNHRRFERPRLTFLVSVTLAYRMNKGGRYVCTPFT